SLVATSTSSSQINLTWSDNSTNETGFKIERGPNTNNFTQIATVGANVTAFSDAGLSSSTKYYYRVRAYNSAGNSGYSNTASASTSPTPPPTPTATPTPTPTPPPTPTPTPNTTPVVNAGPDQTVPTRSATLSGSATDDGLPNPPGALTYKWTKASGPGTVTFANGTAASTTLTFSVGGVYALKLTVSDSVLSGSDTVVITVNKAPVVNAGLDQTVPTLSAVVNGSASDDGLPNPP